MQLLWDSPVLGRAPAPTRSHDATAIHAVRAQLWRYEDRSESPLLSLKWFARGGASYRVGARQHEVRGDAVLLLAPCHGYDVVVDEPAGAESFCLFVPHPIAAAMWAAVARSGLTLLDDPEAVE